MSTIVVTYDPSARYAGTSPRCAQGGMTSAILAV
jgi:hypothetical protein